jgi:hypothetical protein
MWRAKPFFAPHEAIMKRSSAIFGTWNMGSPMATREDLISFICLGVMIVGIAVLGSGLAAFVLT